MRANDGLLVRMDADRVKLPEFRRTAGSCKTQAAPASWISRLFGPRAPTTYHRCLAIHMYYAGPHSSLS